MLIRPSSQARRHNRKFATDDSDDSDDEPLGKKLAKAASVSSSLGATSSSNSGTSSSSSSSSGSGVSGSALSGQSEVDLAKEDDAQLRALPKVIFCSRTHSQLAQFVREVRKTAFKNARVVSLGSRKNLCINPDVKKLSSESRINDACLDLKEKNKKNKTPLAVDSAAVTAPLDAGATADSLLKKRKKSSQNASSTKGCPFHGFEVTQSLADQSLAKVGCKYIPITICLFLNMPTFMIFIPSFFICLLHCFFKWSFSSSRVRSWTSRN